MKKFTEILENSNENEQSEEAINRQDVIKSLEKLGKSLNGQEMETIEQFISDTGDKKLLDKLNKTITDFQKSLNSILSS